MKIDVVVLPIDGSLLAFTVFLPCVAIISPSGTAAKNSIRLPNLHTYVVIIRSSLNLPHSFRRSFCCMFKTRASSSLGSLKYLSVLALALVRCSTYAE